MTSLDRTGAERTVLAITGMTCSSCAGTVKRVLERVPGAIRAEVDLAADCAVVEGSARAADLVAAARAAGYGAEIVPAKDAQGEGEA